MIKYLPKLKASGIGFIIVFLTFFIMTKFGMLLLPDDAPLEIALIFSVWWFLASLLVYNYSYFKEKRKIVLKITALFVFFIVTLFMDNTWQMPDNPLTIFLLVLFWIGIVYILSPDFLLKYGNPCYLQ